MNECFENELTQKQKDNEYNKRIVESRENDFFFLMNKKTINEKKKI